MTKIKIANEASIVAKDTRYVYKIQEILHEREDESGTKNCVDAIRIAYWKNGKFKQDAPIMLREEFVSLIRAGIGKNILTKQDIERFTAL
ncbi:hypothetical protein MUP79_02735 [Candidatus Bathyarchaeota archaeon]|nr:hypothetical protein [Candidatus Bathyarchaeota archaeon]